MISASELREILHYDPLSGEFRWRVTRGSSRAGDLAGSVGANGYRRISLGKKSYQAYRLAWLYVYGKWPLGWVDHRSRQKSDDRIANLRDATPQQSAINRHHGTPNKYGLMGVSKKGGKWVAKIRDGENRRYLGTYNTAEEANASFEKARAMLHGEFAEAEACGEICPSDPWSPEKRLTELTAEGLRSLLDYDPATGLFRWRDSRTNVKAGSVAGTISRYGYRILSLSVGGKKRKYLSGRLVWLYVHGAWPVDEIDHINGVRDDDRLSNLREANRDQQMANRRCHLRSKSQLKGVESHHSGKWSARICVFKKRIYIGNFDTPEEASWAYRVHAEFYHGEFVRTA
jgi:hypothetical protein